MVLDRQDRGQICALMAAAIDTWKTLYVPTVRLWSGVAE
jgi:hypothetical protein